MLKTALAAAAAIPLMMSAPAFSQQQAPANPPGAMPTGTTVAGVAIPGQKDIGKHFAQAAAASGLYEVASSELALKQTRTDEVRQFAQRMISDHRAANKALMQIAQKNNMTVEKSVGAGKQLMLAALAMKSGEQFDRNYIHQQINAHRDAIALFRLAAEQADNQELQQFARQLLPTLQQHLELAKDIGGDMDLDTLDTARLGQ